MENSGVPAIEEIKQEYKANHKRLAELDKELNLKIARFKAARDKGLEIWKQIKELEESYNTKLDIELYEFNENYYYVVEQLDAVREESHVIAERQKNVKALKTALAAVSDEAPERTFYLGRDGHELVAYENKLAHEEMINNNLEKQLVAEVEQMRALTVINFMECGELSKYPELESLKKNIDNLREIFGETMTKASELQNEIFTIQNEKDKYVKIGMEQLVNATAKILGEDKDIVLEQLKAELRK